MHIMGLNVENVSASVTVSAAIKAHCRHQRGGGGGEEAETGRRWRRGGGGEAEAGRDERGGPQKLPSPLFRKSGGKGLPHSTRAP